MTLPANGSPGLFYGGPQRTGSVLPSPRASPYEPRITSSTLTTNAVSSQVHDRHSFLGMTADNGSLGASSGISQTGGGIALSVESQYQAYAPPSLRSSQPHSTPQISALHSAELERLVEQHTLHAQRHFLENFMASTIKERLNYTIVHMLITSANVAKLADTQNQIIAQITRLERLCQLAWQPTKTQTRLLRGLIRHYLIKPISTYKEVADIVQGYLCAGDHAKKMRLELYLTDLTVRQTVDDYITEQVGQQKSLFRKVIFNSCKKKIPLNATARNLLDNYHLPYVPEVVPDSMKATVALLREVAAPLASNSNKGGDTGFWKAVEEKLEALYTANSANAAPGEDDRETGEAWLEWQAEIIEDDVARFGTSVRKSHRGAAMSAITRAELNAQLGAGIDNYVHELAQLDETLNEAPRAGSSVLPGGAVLPQPATQKDIDEVLADMHESRYVSTPTNEA